ncbi:MAG: adenylate/guanylate cyclase domain-containing protein [Pseudomonadota bacterium]
MTVENSRLTVLMFADLVGFSGMMEKDADAALSAVRLLKSELFEPIVEAQGGVVLKRLGDGWIIEFPSVASAHASGVDVQTGLAGHPGIRLRVGCHIGEIIEDDDDFYGSGVNIAQRVQSEAPPGGLMVSEDFFRQLPTAKTEGLADAGTFNLKNISQPVRLYQWRPSPGPARRAGDVASIAVGPIASIPVDADTRAVAEDIREQLLIRMSRRQGIRVLDATEENADADYDLRSRLRLAAGKGRLSLTLILREEGRPVWSENYDGDAEDVFAFSDEALEQAEGDLRVYTNAFEGDRLAHLPDAELSVSELRARAANYFYKMTLEGWAYGCDLMERATALNPEDAISQTMRVEAQIMVTMARHERFAADKADDMVRALDFAVEAAPRSDYVFWTRGFLRSNVLGDVAGARSDLRRSREINPAYLECHELEGMILMLEERFEDAVAAFGRLTSRGASNIMLPYRLYLKAVARLGAEDYRGAAQDIADAADLYPNVRSLKHLQASALEKAGDVKEAERLRRAAAELRSDPAIVTRRLNLPAAYDWINQALAPTD